MLTALNLNGGAPVDPEHIRWYKSCELIYDVESADGYLTTYLYHTVIETETGIGRVRKIAYSSKKQLV